MDSIIIGFSRPKSWFEPFSWIIRLFTWSQFSHAYIQYYNAYADRWMVFQASGILVNFIGRTMFETKENIRAEFEIPVTTLTKLKTVEFAIDNVGLPYGLGQVFGFLLVLIVRIFKKHIKNPFANTSSFFCSELTAQILTEILQPNDSLDPTTMSPQDLYEYLISKNYKPLVDQSAYSKTGSNCSQ